MHKKFEIQVDTLKPSLDRIKARISSIGNMAHSQLADNNPSSDDALFADDSAGLNNTTMITFLGTLEYNFKHLKAQIENAEKSMDQGSDAGAMLSTVNNIEQILEKQMKALEQLIEKTNNNNQLISSNTSDDDDNQSVSSDTSDDEETESKFKLNDYYINYNIEHFGHVLKTTYKHYPSRSDLLMIHNTLQPQLENFYQFLESSKQKVKSMIIPNNESPMDLSLSDDEVSDPLLKDHLITLDGSGAVKKGSVPLVGILDCLNHYLNELTQQIDFTRQLPQTSNNINAMVETIMKCQGSLKDQFKALEQLIEKTNNAQQSHNAFGAVASSDQLTQKTSSSQDSNNPSNLMDNVDVKPPLLSSSKGTNQPSNSR